MAGPIKLEVNHEELTNDRGMEWSMTFEEVLGGQGRSTLVVQDRLNAWYPQAHWDVRLSIRSGLWSGFTLFRGETMRPKLILPNQKDWRSWGMDCGDYNSQMVQRLIGAFDGRTWQDVDGLGDYVNIDPNGHTLKTDKLTVQALFDAYMRIDGGTAIETDTFVYEYLADLPTITWDYSNLQRALEELASEIAANLQFWIDPDLSFHWVTIPAWQDALQGLVALSGPTDPASTTALMKPEAASGQLPTAPYMISDVRDLFDDTQIGCSDLTFDFDGGDMPEQIYVRGATGYVYNAPVIDPMGGSTVINPEGYGSKASDKFGLTFLSATKVWHRQSNGLVSSSFDTASTGGPFDVKFIRIAYNPANGKGGHYWQLLNGPNAGKLVDNDTNYFGYGHIRVVKYIETVTPPSVGVGGSGWVNEIVQDPNKRQAYLEAAISDTQAKRDSIGGQALYRASFPTLRGSFKVKGKPNAATGEQESRDGWRSGQLVNITDARLPVELNGMWFVIQRVKGSLLEGTNVREYDIDFGDGPTSRYTYEPPKGGGDVTWPPPAVLIEIQERDLAPGPNAKQIIIGQLKAKDGTPWEIAGKVVKWTLEVYNAAGVLQSGQGDLDPEVSATDAHGKARTTLTTGAGVGLIYFVFADVPVE